MFRIIISLLLCLAFQPIAASDADDSGIISYAMSHWQQTGDEQIKQALFERISLEEKAETLRSLSLSIVENGSADQAHQIKIRAAYQALAARRTSSTIKLLDSRPTPKQSIVMHEDVVSLDHEMFEKSYVDLGYNDPAEFHKRVESGIYLLDQYQPEKAVMLFVHGHGGSPKDFDYLVQNLDKTKFQAWVFYYPSGEPVDDTSKRLLSEIQTLKGKYGFTDLHLSGHSLGGVVIRNMFTLKNTDREVPGLKSVLTIASPNKGVTFKFPMMFELVCLLILEHVDKSLAELYVSSPMLNEINSQPVTGVKFVTFAGTKPKNWLFSLTSRVVGGTNDGLIKVENAAIDGAVNKVLPEDHTTIRLTPAVATALNGL